MDLVAYGGTGIGIIIALIDFRKGVTDFKGAIVMILLALEFFMPMRTLGSFFHVAMNGVGAAKRIFAFLEIPEPPAKQLRIDDSDLTITLENVSFQYEPEREVIQNVSFVIAPRQLTAIVGESGSGKSTIGNLISGTVKGYSGSLRIGNLEINEITEESLMSHITTVSDRSYIFKGSIRSNLQIAKMNATDEELWNSLGECNLKEFAETQEGLETRIAEGGANLSGGQRQRLALARALLADRSIYIFDEATSNIDAESEAAILAVIDKLCERKTVLLISHRLANVVKASQICVMQKGVCCERGTHDELMANESVYSLLFTTQYNLEHRNG
jgi:ABC-type transport system involved in cytochrome bd biosynthesis fused ATPase/permease subunit